MELKALYAQARHVSASSEPPEVRLTVAERITLHLLRQVGRGDDWQAPVEVTSSGIAEAVGVSRAHASVELKKLMDANRVKDKLRHIAGGKKRKTYALTEAGYSRAVGLRRSIEASTGCAIESVIVAPCLAKRVTHESLQNDIHRVRESAEATMRRCDRLENEIRRMI